MSRIVLLYILWLCITVVSLFFDVCENCWYIIIDIYKYMYIYVCLSVSIYLYLCLSIYISLYIYMSVCVYQAIYPPTYLSLSVCLSM